MRFMTINVSVTMMYGGEAEGVRGKRIPLPMPVYLPVPVLGRYIDMQAVQYIDCPA